jgi:hypothetical protein
MVVVGQRLQAGDVRGEGEPAVADGERRVRVHGAHDGEVPRHQGPAVEGRGEDGRGQAGQ